jgi:hypothetical protein
LCTAVEKYLDKMATRFPDVPRVKLVGPNTLSALGAAKDYLPRLLKTAGRYLDVVSSHDYDPRGDRWGASSMAKPCLCYRLSRLPSMQYPNHHSQQHG